MPSPIDLGARSGGPLIADGSVVRSEEARLVVSAVSDSLVRGTGPNGPQHSRRRSYSVPTKEPWRYCRISGKEFFGHVVTSENIVGH
ncbi:MAG: hypothetical protein KDK50_06610 [Chlamydiia bacterium]|nr:hypothetical protein [Chlamydiia bacterium]